jgi:hypothetical protein
MNAVEVLRSAFNSAHRWYDGTVADVTTDQANYVPAGRVHPIGELMTHTLQSEDMIIQGLIQGRPTVWESGGWGDRLGLPMMFSQTADAARSFRIADPAVLRPYADAVYAATNAYFDGLTDADLDRRIDMTAFGQGMERVGDVLVGFPLGNTFAHTGEISSLKGVQGARGYPF